MSARLTSKSGIQQQSGTLMGRTHSRSLSPRKDSLKKDKRSSLIIPSYAQFAPASSQQAPPREPSPEQNTEETDILTLLAAQERRVLELKEQLAKAEDELQNLRKEWAANQSTKRRNEGRRMHQMRPLSISSAKNVDSIEDQDDIWMYEEMEKRKALLGNTKTSHRRVFSSSRHAKELTLLSPDKTTPDPMSRDRSEERETRQSRDPVKKPAPPSPLEMNSEPAVQTNRPIFEPEQRDRNESRSPQREDILKTGKQVATDLRDGLWTFFEDLRQAAVGDEPRMAQQTGSNLSRQPNSTGATSRSKSPDEERSNLGSLVRSDSPDVGGAFWKEHGLAEPTNLSKFAVTKTTKVYTPRKPSIHTFDSDGDAWETWDSPSSPAVGVKKRTSSSQSRKSSPNTSVTSSTEATPRAPGIEQPKQREAIPWPSLTKLAPGQLRRTASHLMEELERSLTPQSGVTESIDGLLR